MIAFMIGLFYRKLVRQLLSAFATQTVLHSRHHNDHNTEVNLAAQVMDRRRCSSASTALSGTTETQAALIVNCQTTTGTSGFAWRACPTKCFGHSMHCAVRHHNCNL